MPSTGFKWKFDKGYAELLDTASVELKLESGPSVTELEARPSTLFRGGKQLDLAFSLSRTLSGSAACGFAWVLEPAGRITAALIPEGAAYLGNFRVPAGHYGVQWKLNPSVSGAAIPGFTSAVSATAGSRLTQTWVELFPLDTPLLQALRDTWSGCVDPFDPAGAVSLAPSQVLRWDWSGTFRMEAGFAWSLEKGWEVGVSNPLIRCRLPFRTGVEFSGQALLSTGGHFYIQLSNRNDTLKFSLIREGSTESGTGASIGIDFSSSPSLKAEAGLLDPLLEPPEKVLRDCLKRKFRISLNAEALKLGRRKMVLRAGWRIPVSSRAVEEYADLVTGRIPPPRDEFSGEGRFDSVSGSRFSVMLNILNRTTGFEKERDSFDSVVVDPGGNLLIENGISRTDTRYRWDESEFVRLAFSRLKNGKDEFFRWNWETSGGFTRRELTRLLRAILHGGIIPRFLIPGHLRFPLKLAIAASTEFSGRGIEGIRKANPGRQWETLIKALTLVYPERYRRGSHWRDWIDVPEVRQEIVRNPVHCHLSSCYPVRGRTDVQRRQAADDYRRALRFLETMDLWQGGGDPIQLLDRKLDFPLFLYFHLLCPPGLKRSDLTATGDWEMEWREPGAGEAEA